MKRQLLSLLALSTLSAYAQVGIEPFAPAVAGTYVGNFDTFSNGDDIPSTSAFDEEGDTGGADNAWTADDGTTVAAFPGGIGTWASATCDFGNELTLITPVMNFGTNTTNPELTFRYVIDNGAGLGAPGLFGNIAFEVMYKESAGGSWNTLGTYGIVDDVWHDITIDLSGAGSYATYYLGFRAYGVSAGSFYTWGYGAIDQVVVTGVDGSCTPTSSAFNLSACDSQTSPSGLYTWTVDGVYNDTIPNTNGCDSVMVITVDISTIDNGASVTGYSITADEAGAAYQWLDCNNAYAEIAGATSQTYSPAVDGDYAVEVTENGCIDTSSCFNISGLGLQNITQEVFSVYPNPTTGNLHVSLGNGYLNTTLAVYSVDGQLVQNTIHATQALVTFQLEGETGVYFLHIITPDETRIVRVVKK